MVILTLLDLVAIRPVCDNRGLNALMQLLETLKQFGGHPIGYHRLEFHTQSSLSARSFTILPEDLEIAMTSRRETVNQQKSRTRSISLSRTFRKLTTRYDGRFQPCNRCQAVGCTPDSQQPVNACQESLSVRDNEGGSPRPNI